MTRETQIGLSLVLALCGVFGFLVYKKIQEPSAVIAGEPDRSGDPGKIAAGESDPKSDKELATPTLLAGPAPKIEKTSAETQPAVRPIPELADRSGDKNGTPITASAPAKPKMPTLLPDDSGEPFGGTASKTAAGTNESGFGTETAVVSGSVTEEEDPFGTTAAASQETPAESSAPDDGFGPTAPLAAKLPTAAEEPVLDPTGAGSPAQQDGDDPFGASGGGSTATSETAMEAPENTEPEAAETTGNVGFGPGPAATASKSLPKDEFSASADEFNAGRDSERETPAVLTKTPTGPLVPEPEEEPGFGDPLPTTPARTSAPAALLDPDFEDVPTAKPAPRVALPTNLDGAAEQFESPVQLQKPEALELTQSAQAPTASEEADPFGSSAESTTQIESPAAPKPSVPAAMPTPTFAEQGTETFDEPKPVIEKSDEEFLKPRTSRPAPPAAIEETEDFPPVSATPRPQTPAPQTPGLPRPVAEPVVLPKLGPITTDKHMVEPNETFWSLAQRRYGVGRYGVALAELNKDVVPDPEKIRPGTVVKLPAAQVLEQQFGSLIPKTPSDVDPKNVKAGPGQYVIQEGDSFWAISKKVYGDPRYFDALQAHNSETAKHPTLKPGTLISTPAVSVLEQQYASMIQPAAVPATKPPGVAMANSDGSESPGLFTSDDGQPLYRVADGENLTAIAKNTLGRSSRWVQILHLNRDTLKDGNTLVPGTVLRMPADANQVQISGLERDRR